MNPSTRSGQAIAPSQIKAIHAVVNSLGMDDDNYRAMLHDRYRVGSCKDLSPRQADDLLDDLNRKAGRPLTPRPLPRGERGLKHSDLDNRPGYATGAQIRLIEAMWAQVSFTEDSVAREKGLNAFCFRIAKVSGLRMVTRDKVQQLVKALEKMGAKHKYKGGSL